MSPSRQAVLEVGALGWVLWTCAAWLAVQSSISTWVSASLVVAVLVTVAMRRPARPGVTTAVLGLGSIVLSAWVLITLAVGQGLGGDVVWVLPEWVPSSGAPMGGPVTSGRLLVGVEQALRALAQVALLGLLLAALPGERLGRLADATLGSLAIWVHPVCFLGDALDRRHRDRSERALHGLGAFDGGLATLVRHCKEAADTWGRGSGVRDSGLVVRVRLLVLTAAGTAAAVLAMQRRLVGAEAALAALAVGALVGVLLSRARPVRGALPELIPGSCAVVPSVLLALGADEVLIALSLLILPLTVMAVPVRQGAAPKLDEVYA